MKLFIGIFFVFTFLQSSEKVELSYGIGAGFLSAPEYIGSKKTKSYFLPFPFFEYKTDKVNISRDKIDAKFIDTKKYKIYLSLRGMLRVNSKNTLRVGMPNLPATLEIGPNFIYSIFKDKNNSLNFEIPLRAVFAVSSRKIFYTGYLTNLNFDFNQKLYNNIKLTFKTGIVFADKKYNNFYYSVSNKYVTSKRSEYYSNFGYSGWQNSLGISKKDKNIWYGAFVKYYDLSNVVYKESPLYESKSALFYGFAFSYLF